MKTDIAGESREGSITAFEFGVASDALKRAGWDCISGMYPGTNPPAVGNQPVTWVARYARQEEYFVLSAKTVGSHAFQRAIGLCS